MNRRALLGGMAATAAGLLVPEWAVAEPARKVWALDRTKVATRPASLAPGDFAFFGRHLAICEPGADRFTVVGVYDWQTDWCPRVWTVEGRNVTWDAVERTLDMHPNGVSRWDVA